MSENPRLRNENIVHRLNQSTPEVFRLTLFAPPCDIRHVNVNRICEMREWAGRINSERQFAGVVAVTSIRCRKSGRLGESVSGNRG
jgi:hypothetical protein